MPFKFGMRKACRYAVSSKCAFIVCVHLLDRPLMDCVLTFESTGRDCLESVAQRIELSDIEYFGLRYIDRRLQFRWVDLDRPLKKQLDKHAESPLLYFGIMFYVNNVMSIQDTLARYQFYIHIKADIIDGKLLCSPEQAVLFAAYAVQAEIGDFDPQVHGTDYLSEFQLLPKAMIADEVVHKQLLHEVAVMHQRLHGVPPPTAELQFILDAQELDGYGREYYPVKDMSGTELQIGASYVGIHIRAINDQPSIYFRWSDIRGFSRNRKLFGIDTTLSVKPFQFQLDDAGMAKYVFNMCQLQLDFYKSHSVAESTPSPHEVPQISFNDFNQTTSTVSPQQTDSTNQTVIINESMSSDGSVAAQLRQQTQQLSAAPHPVISYTSSAPDVYYCESRLPGVGSYHDDNGVVADTPHGSAESSYVHFEEHGEMLPARQNVAVVSTRPEAALQPWVPAYRPAPDYDTVMQQRMLAQYYPSYVHPYLNPDCTSFSQPDIYQHSAVVGQWNPGYGRVPATATHAVDRASSLVIHPAAVGVARHASVASSMVPRTSQYLYYRAPPPYPRQSSSTPDLASPTKLGAILTHGGPDLQQQRLLHGAVPQSQFDESLENLAAEVQQAQIFGSRSIDPRYGLSNTDSSSIQLGQSGLAVHPENVVDISRPSISSPYVSNAGARFDHGSTEANRLPDFVQFDDRHVRDAGRGQLDQSCIPFIGGEIEAGAGQLNGRDRFVHYGSGSDQIYVEQVGQCLPVLSGHRMCERGSHSSVGSVASSTKLSAAGSAVKRPSRCASVSSDIANSFTVTPLDEQHMTSQPIIERLTSSNYNPSLPIDDRRQALESKLEGQLFAEFEQIAKKRLKCECLVATLERNREQNRFKDVFPYDDNRVCITPNRTNPDGYINASHIKVKVGNEEFWYIATQAPMSHTVVDFWQMIWQHGVSVVAMLTGGISIDGQDEQDKQRCACYWPHKLGPQHQLSIGDFEISLSCTSGSGPYITNGLLVRHRPSGKQRVVWHLRYTDWPDQGCPANHHNFLDFVSELEAIRRQVTDIDGAASSTPSPIVVHCSAGVGRTGVVILIAVMKASLERNQTWDVASVLRSLRDQRMHLVQTVTQYSYVYRVLVTYLQSSRLI